MMSRPEVSIIVQNKNYGDLLGYTLESIKNQQFDKKIQVVGIDAGSTDNSVEIYKKHPFVELLQYKGTQPECLNKALKLVDGKYVSWINSDDYYSIWFLQKSIEAHKTNLCAALSYGNVRFIDKNKNLGGLHVTPKMEFKKLINGNYVYHCSVLFNTKMLREAGGFCEDFSNLFDLELYLRLLYTYGDESAVKSDSTSYYRWHPRMLTLTDSMRSNRQTLEVIQKWRKILGL